MAAIDKYSLTGFKVNIIEGSRDGKMHISIAPI